MAMNNLVIPPTFTGGPAAIFGGAGADDDLGAGLSAGFAVIGYRGKTWSIRHKGEELALMRDDGDGPLNSIEVVIAAAPNHLSKTWYESGWSEGSAAPPDCASSNGVVPDAGVPKRQNDVCATCRWNAFGSRPPVPGQTQQFKGKACADNKRLAVVPLGDILNEQFGGPMLLRCPPASLTDLQALASQLKQVGFPYYAAGIKISFDTTVSYPKFIFKPFRPLSEEEGKLVLEIRGLDLTNQIIHGDAPPAKADEPHAAQHVPPTQAEPAAQQPVAQAAVQTAPEPAPVAPTPAQPPPTQQAEPRKSTGFGGSAKPAEQATSQSASPKTASGNGFGGGQNGQASDTPAQSEPAMTGVPQFDSALEAKLEGLM